MHGYWYEQNMNRTVFKMKVHANFSPYGYFFPIYMVIALMENTTFKKKHDLLAPPNFI